MKKGKKLVFIILITIAVLLLITLSLNFYVKFMGESKILTLDEISKLNDIDCVLVLGCQVKEDGTPSHMLEDRLKSAVKLYKEGAADKIIMSGDHTGDYNEVAVMKEYAIERGVKSEDIYLDHYGFSTYESIYRAKNIFSVNKIIIISQRYHLYRAIYLSEAFGIEAYGFESAENTYQGQIFRDIREVLARVKDIFLGAIKPEPEHLGDKISLSNSGDLT